MTARGKFLVLEGIDGCGKSTQLRHLATWLPSSGLMPPGAGLICSREPGGTALGLALRQLLLHPPEGLAPHSRTELLLYAADRAQHVQQCIEPALAAGNWVLCDRFSGSTAAYQGFGRGLDQALIDQLEQLATAGLRPDLCLWLALDPLEAAQRRAGERADRIEAEGLAFLGRVHAGFSALAKRPGWQQVCGQGAVDQVQARLQACLQQWFAQNP
ncbi:dTMP kinase [Synechococcus sp. UW140]|uniref:dTMP kinase n=1 Tax=Synechococcus sp. UW140 TaxID=368503 RepID=UPI003137A880